MESEQKKILRFDKEKKLVVDDSGSAKKEEAQEEAIDFSKALSLSTELGLSIALPIAGGALLGHFIDERLTTAPRVTLFFIFLGIVIAGMNFYKIYKEMFK